MMRFGIGASDEAALDLNDLATVPREMAKTGAFCRVPKAPFLGVSNTAPDRNP
jgi:hypothetical protein